MVADINMFHTIVKLRVVGELHSSLHQQDKGISGVATQSRERAHPALVSGVTSTPGGKEIDTTATGDKGYHGCHAWTSELDEGTCDTIQEIFFSSGTVYRHSVRHEACYLDS